ncbi:MAG TPA: cytochrome P450 [Pseudonocardiaceae bacterium]|jgi:cytochrome P450|nr:cytochrome P450 [Pseudonocardiaceae bacterium]
MTGVATPTGLCWDDQRQAWTVGSQRLANIVFGDRHVSVVQEPELATSWVRPADETPTVTEFFGSWFSRSPRHRQVRHELRRPYSAGLVAELEAMFTEVAEEFAAGLTESGDLMNDYLTPYGMRTTARMMDVPDSEWANLNKVIAVITAFLKKPLQRTFSANSAEMNAMRVCIDYLRELVETLFAQPNPGPLVAALKQISVADGASIWLAVTTIGQLLAAGVEPMTTGAGVACRELYGDSELRAAVLAGTVPIGEVAEEALRLNPPFPFIHRWVQQPCDCLGVHIEPGTYLVIDVRAVNNDPDVLEAPGEFRPHRAKHQNQTFGRGVHHCLGMRSGRLQIAVALSTLLHRVPGLRIGLDKVDVADLGYVLAVNALPYEVSR